MPLGRLVLLLFLFLLLLLLLVFFLFLLLELAVLGASRCASLFALALLEECFIDFPLLF